MRNFSVSRFGGARFGDEGENPMDGVANLADVMLVLACGLMLALVINWNVDIAPRPDGDAARGDEFTQQVEMEGGDGDELDPGAPLEKMGEVYLDPATGKMYLIN